MTPFGPLSYPDLPPHHFTYENHGATNRMNYPFKSTAPFTYRLDAGWKVLGWCWNRRLGGMKRREDGEEFVAVMFESPEKLDYWWHAEWSGKEIRFL